MQDHSLRVGGEIVIEDHIRQTILAVEEDEVFFGITAEANGVPGPVACPWQPRLMAVPEPLPSDNCYRDACSRPSAGCHASKRRVILATKAAKITRLLEASLGVPST